MAGDNLKSWATILKSTDSLSEKFGAVLPWAKHWLNRPIIVPGRQENWWHMGGMNEKPAMQISTYWHVTNSTDKPIKILNAYINTGRVQQSMVSTKDTNSNFHGSYPIPAHSTTDLHAHFFVAPPFRRAGKPINISITFEDQNGQKRTIKNIPIKSTEQRGIKATRVKLEEEAVFQLAHDIEKNIASILKDEVTRYKKYGRQNGGLGSLHAIYNGRQIKSIYQDGWSHDKLGERLEVVANPENGQIVTENGDALVSLYNGLSDDGDRELFINSLVARLSREKEYFCVSYLIIYVLLRINELPTGLSAANKTLRKKMTLVDKLLFRKPPLLENHQKHGFGDMLGLLNGVLRYEHSCLTPQELDLIESFVKKEDEFGARILEKVYSVRSYRLSSQQKAAS